MIYVLFVCAVALLGFPKTAAAYLDPTTGSMVLQVVIGSFLAALALVKLYWRRLKTLFSSRKADIKKVSATASD